MKKILNTFIALTTLLFTQSCSKTEGCTDSNAENYNTEAEKDCNCCTYSGTVIFWHNKATAQALQSLGSTSLFYYVDNVLINSTSATIYYNNAPSCTQDNLVKAKKSLGSFKTKSYPYKVIDQDDDIIWEGTVTFESSVSCTQVELKM